MDVVMIMNPILPDKLAGLERYVSEFPQRLASHGVHVTAISKRTHTEQPLQDHIRKNGKAWSFAI